MKPLNTSDNIAQDVDTIPAVKRVRPKPGERRVQILRELAQMLEAPGAERITTAALAARLAVSEAALYRHFASKAQMFEALIDFVESSVFGLVAKATEREAAASARTRRIVTTVLEFGEKNPGMSRVMVGDALVFEHERLQQRMNQLLDKFEAALRTSLSEAPNDNAQITASVLTAFVIGRLQRFARSGFRRSPTELLDVCLARIMLPNQVAAAA
jgi:TetR/AcrR family transcriptional regulator